MFVFGGAAAMLGAALAAVGLLYGLCRGTAVAPTQLTVLPSLSGWQPEEHALSRFHARYYPLTLLFLAFDVEMLFMYPWATVVARVGWSAVIEMFALLAVLMAGVLWARREGVLRWV